MLASDPEAYEQHGQHPLLPLGHGCGRRLYVVCQEVEVELGSLRVVDVVQAPDGPEDLVFTRHRCRSRKAGVPTKPCPAAIWLSVELTDSPAGRSRPGVEVHVPEFSELVGKCSPLSGGCREPQVL